MSDICLYLFNTQYQIDNKWFIYIYIYIYKYIYIYVCIYKMTKLFQN